jgi:pimeloyl-ACP methyl ester carboxylesterase
MAEETSPYLLHYKSLLVDFVNVSYIEAGSSGNSAIVLLPALPSSATEFRKLIPLLSKDYRVISPSYPGFGLTSAPENFNYTFSSITKIISGLLIALNITSYATYATGYGADVALRLALENPTAIKAIISQNGNAYVDGFGQQFWAPIFALWNTSNSDAARTVIRDNVLTLDGTESFYKAGTPPQDADLLDPYQWSLDYFQNIEGETRQNRQLDLLYDYRLNVDMYPQFQDYFRKSQVPLLALWGKNDPSFVPAGAYAFRKDLSDAKVHFVDAGHMAVETKLHEIAVQSLSFLKDVEFI